MLQKHQPLKILPAKEEKQANPMTEIYTGLLTEVLQELDFADDVVLLASRYVVDIQDKTDVMAEKSKSIGLDINIEKAKVLRINARTTQPVQSMERT